MTKRDPQPGNKPADGEPKLVNALESDPEFFKDKMIGTTLGKCQIEKFVGEGRTSVVYRAIYAPLKRTVAVKVLLDTMMKHPAVVRVFQLEGRAVAALDHENVLKIYDVGEDKGRHYLVLELLQGKSLLKSINKAGDKGMSVEQALDFTRQAAAGLAAAHRKNLVHRDIKPQNLVVEPDGTLKIVDFGLAAEAEGAFSGGRLGTPHYMSPEQCRGEHALTASDIYALGVTLYHMLIGQPPYKGSKTTQEIIDHHLAAVPLEPESVRSDVPRAVGELVRRMTSFKAADRPPAAQVRDTIATKLSPERLAGRRRTTGKAVRRAKRQQSGIDPMIAIGGGVVLLLIILFVVMSSNKGDDPGVDPALANANANANTPSVHKRTPVKKTPIKKAPRKPTDGQPKLGKEERIKVYLRDARSAEKAEKLTEALFWYQQVMQYASSDSREYQEAEVSAKTIRQMIDEKAGGTQSSRRKRITRKMNEAAGVEFDEKLPQFRERTLHFELTNVKNELKKLRGNTRDKTEERLKIDAEFARIERIEKAFGIVPARAGALPEEKVVWNNYDAAASIDLVVTGANEVGVQVFDEQEEQAKTLKWGDIPVPVRISFLEALRNQGSAEETVWLGYYCKLVGDERASQYFDFARMLDPTPEMARRIRELRAED